MFVPCSSEQNRYSYTHKRGECCSTLALFIILNRLNWNALHMLQLATVVENDLPSNALKCLGKGDGKVTLKGTMMNGGMHLHQSIWYRSLHLFGASDNIHFILKV